MTIKLRLICPEIFGAMPGGDYDVPDSCTAREALHKCVEQYPGRDVQTESLDRVILMLNGKHISPDSPLSEGDSLMVLRPVYGG